MELLCGVQNDNDHLLVCKKGEYVHIRHDALVKVEAEIMREAGCKNVVLEQHLIPTKGDHLKARTGKGDQSRMDVAATGVFSPMERTFFDVRVTHPNAPSNRSIPPSKLYVRHEMEKKVKYEERIIQIEKGSFCPLIFSTSGGVGPLCDNVHKKLAGRIATKRKESYGDVIRFIRTRLRFALLKCVLMGLRGVRACFQQSKACSSVSGNTLRACFQQSKACLSVSGNKLRACFQQSKDCSLVSS